jgi:hypothetical protein
MAKTFDIGPMAYVRVDPASLPGGNSQNGVLIVAGNTPPVFVPPPYVRIEDWKVQYNSAPSNVNMPFPSRQG